MPVSAAPYQALNLPGRGTGLATLGEIAEMKAQQEDRAAIRDERRTLTAQRQAQLEKQQRDQQEAEADQQAVAQAFQQFTDEHGPKRKHIVNYLYQTRPTVATKVEEAFTKAA